MQNLRYFTSMEAFNREKASLPTPCVARIDHEGDELAFFRGNNGDSIYTVGPGSFRVGWSVIGGPAKLR